MMDATFDKSIDILTEKEIDDFVDQHWLEWTMKFELSPCGDLTLHGKREYIKDNIETIKELLDFVRRFGRLDD